MHSAAHTKLSLPECTEVSWPCYQARFMGEEMHALRVASDSGRTSLAPLGDMSSPPQPLSRASAAASGSSGPTAWSPGSCEGAAPSAKRSSRATSATKPLPAKTSWSMLVTYLKRRTQWHAHECCRAVNSSGRIRTAEQQTLRSPMFWKTEQGSGTELMSSVPNLRQEAHTLQERRAGTSENALVNAASFAQWKAQSATTLRTRQRLLALRVWGQPDIRLHVPLQRLLVRTVRAGLAVAAGLRRRSCFDFNYE